MGQQQLGALVLFALGILVAAGSGSAALGRRRRHERAHKPLWRRLLATLATVGLVVSFVTAGGDGHCPPVPQPPWVAQGGAGGFRGGLPGFGILGGVLRGLPRPPPSGTPR